MKTKAQLEEQFRLKPGSSVMLAPNVFLANGEKHPACGQVGKVTSLAAANAIVKMKVGDETSSFLILPKEMWIVLPDFYVNIHNEPGGYWYELSDIGKRATAHFFQS